MMKTHGKIALSAVIVSIFAVVSAYSYGNTHGKNEGEIAGINSVTDKVQRDYNKAQNKIDELYNENSSLQSEKDALEKASKEKKDDKKSDKKDDKKKKSRSSTSKRPASNSGNKSSGGSNSPSIPKKLKDGVYEGSSSGYSGDVKVKVTVSVGKIADIQVSHSETPEYYAKAQAVIGKILSAQNTQVDSVSGATITSNAIKSAVSKALANAGDNSGCGTSAVDITELNNLKLKNKELQDQSKKFEDNLKKLQAELDKANSEGGGKLKDGEFEGEAQGYEGAIKVKVKVKKEKITSITVVSHTETAGYYEKGAEVIPKIIAAQNTKVDATSGATITGNGIKSAVNKALKKSRGDNSSDGADTAELENMKKKNEEQKTQIDDLNKQISGLQEQLSSNIGELTKNKKKGKGIGYNKTVPIKVKVVIKDKKIASVEVASHKEDKEYYKDFSLMYGKVIGKNNAKDVDVISHGTSSSHGIQAAINSALRKSASGNSSTDSDSEINKTLIEKDG